MGSLDMPPAGFASANDKPPEASVAPITGSSGTAAPAKDPAEISFHKKILPCPPALCSFSSEEGRKLYKESLASGGAEASFRLLEQFHTQNEPAYCGLGTLVMVLNALGVDPGRNWKGPWRWFHEDMLDCCEPLESIRQNGIIFESFVCLARCNFASVEAFRPTDDGETLEKFRSRLIASVSQGDGPILVVSYSRKAFKQTGDGHYSPIGAYHQEKDAALILDVARFKLPPHWVPVPLLWEALQYLDSSTGRCRGYALLSLKSHTNGVNRGTPYLSLIMPAWHAVSAALQNTKDVFKEDESAAGLASEELGRRVIAKLSTELQGFKGLVRPSPDSSGADYAATLEELSMQVFESLKDLSSQGFIFDQRAWAPQSGAKSDTVFAADMLALPPEVWLPDQLLESPLAKALDADRLPSPLAGEVLRLRGQLTEILAGGKCCSKHCCK
eukprot:TRINITY_DN72623_c0_g1_i1.p1 TRINITY_DN72623_c0_g1~~TRINITY_DN72623_c0_g1_i1.p1  ORF type:complete len:444 (+),score=64.57 TRINITY_DN72623_c0_g1_i1:47-1378(+)